MENIKYQKYVKLCNKHNFTIIPETGNWEQHYTQLYAAIKLYVNSIYGEYYLPTK